MEPPCHPSRSVISSYFKVSPGENNPRQRRSPSLLLPELPARRRLSAVTCSRPSPQKQTQPACEDTAPTNHCLPAGGCHTCTGAFQAQATRQLPQQARACWQGGGAGWGKVWGFLDSTPREGMSCSGFEVALQSCSSQHLSILRRLHSPAAQGGPCWSSSLLRSTSRHASPALSLLPQLQSRTLASGRRPSPCAKSSVEPSGAQELQPPPKQRASNQSRGGIQQQQSKP